MCRCRPEVKTPFCGRPGCEVPWRTEKPVAAVSKEQRYLEALKRLAVEKFQRMEMDWYPEAQLVDVGGIRFLVSWSDGAGKAELVIE